MRVKWFNGGIRVLTASALASALIMPWPIQAEEDYSDEEAWYEKCSQVQTSRSGVEACQGFLDYQKQQKETLCAAIENYTSEIANLENSTAQVEQLIEEQRDLISQLNTQISEKETRISDLEAGIENVQVRIDEKQAQIDVWDAQIRSRMQQEQSSLGVNMAVDIIMGASDLSDMIRRLTGIERITQSDQSQVDELEKARQELDFQKEELVRLSDNLTSEKDDLVQQQKQAEDLENSYTILEAQYHQQMADLRQAKTEAMAKSEEIKEFSIKATQILADSIVPVDGLIFPVSGGYQSAGTWAYPDGGLHLGLDWAVNSGTQLVAPADGLILYANNPTPSDTGYLGNWTGWPAGAGNTVIMLVNINGTLYSLSFFHLSQEGMTVKAGDTVTQGQPIALTGHTGNSTGPHLHMEIINLGDMTLEQAITQFSTSPDATWGTTFNSTATACENTSATPCRERPEKFFTN